jgi:hypothetical protein
MRNDLNNPNRLDADRRSGFGSMGIMVAVAFALVLGLLFWGMADRSNTVATNSSPGVTTGSSTAPAAPATPNTGPTNTR